MKRPYIMLLEENKALMCKVIEDMNKQRNPALVDDFLAPDFVDHTNQLRGPEEVKQLYTTLFKSFPDYHKTIENIIAEGDEVWVQSTTTMTHTGEFRGIAPTGKKVTVKGVNIYRIVDGKMVETWSVTDSLELLREVGIIEYTEKAKQLFPPDDSVSAKQLFSEEEPA